MVLERPAMQAATYQVLCRLPTQIPCSAASNLNFFRANSSFRYSEIFINCSQLFMKQVFWHEIYFLPETVGCRREDSRVVFWSASPDMRPMRFDGVFVLSKAKPPNQSHRSAHPVLRYNAGYGRDKQLGINENYETCNMQPTWPGLQNSPNLGLAFPTFPRSVPRPAHCHVWRPGVLYFLIKGDSLSWLNL